MQLIAVALSPFLESMSMPSPIAPCMLPSEKTTEAQLSQNFSQMYILMGKALYSRNACCNNQLKTIFPQRIHFSRFTPIFPGFLIKFQYFSRTGKTVVIFPGFPGAVGTLSKSTQYFEHVLAYLARTTRRGDVKIFI